MQNFIFWKKAKEDFRRILKEEKRKYCIEMANSFNIRTPMAATYESVRRIRGAVPRKINVLKEHRQYYTTPLAIANKLADSFSKISSSQNFENMNKHKPMRDTDRIPFVTEEDLVYSKDFSESELNAALKAKDAAPGPDGISYKMLKELPQNTRQFLLKLLYKFYQEAYFPDQWRVATVLPFPKPKKDHRKNGSPRLYDYLEMNKIIANI